MVKTFKDKINPAMQFITIEKKIEEIPIKKIEKPAPCGYKVNPLYIETKSRRLQLLLKPSLYKKIKDIATHEGKSVNDVIHSFLEKIVEGSLPTHNL